MTDPIRTLTSGFVLALLLVPGVAAADREAATFGVSEYDTVCDFFDDLPPALGVETSFYTEINLYSSSLAFDQIERNQNLYVDSKDFVDSSFGGDDNADPSGTDFADLIFFAGHGGKSGTGSLARTAVIMGDADPGECWVWLTDDIILGDTDAETFVMYASYVLDYDAYDSGNLDSLDGGGSGSQLAVINGMHGSPIGGNELIVYMGDYAYYARADGLGDDWLDTFYDDNGDGTEDCPVSMIFAANTSEAADAYDYGGLADSHATGTHSNRYYFYYAGCDPHGSPEL